MDYLQMLYPRLIFSVPQIIVYIVGIVLAYSRLQTEPRKARLALISFIGFLFLVFWEAFSQMYVISLSGQERWEMVATIFSIISMVVSVGVWALLLVALFGKSEKYEKYETTTFQNGD